MYYVATLTKSKRDIHTDKDSKETIKGVTSNAQ